MNWYDKIIAAHTAVTSAVRHHEKMKSDRYLVWQEDSPRTDLIAESRHTERVINGSTDLFTKQEFDPWAEELEKSFERYGIAYERLGTQYEEDTGFTHVEWAWSVTDGHS